MIHAWVDATEYDARVRIPRVYHMRLGEGLLLVCTRLSGMTGWYWFCKGLGVDEPEELRWHQAVLDEIPGAYKDIDNDEASSDD